MITAAASTTNGGSAAGGFIFIALGIVAYWIPTVVAMVRHVRNTGSVFVINLLTGWTGIGWVVALAMACRSVDRAAAAPSSSPPPPAAGAHEVIPR